MDGSARHSIRDALRQDFGALCTYCERLCQSTTGTGNIPDEATIDHFRPRSRFPEQRFDWLNLMYACHRCNQTKGDSWPGFGNAVTESLLPASEYVNPNSADGQRPAEEYFSFNAETGEIAPADGLPLSEWNMALRTIRDIDLNDNALGENEARHLWNRRLRQRELLIQSLDTLDDFDSKVQMMFEFMLPDKPFSGFITAYLISRFPSLARLLRRS